MRKSGTPTRAVDERQQKEFEVDAPEPAAAIRSSDMAPSTDGQPSLGAAWSSMINIEDAASVTIEELIPLEYETSAG